MAKTAKATKGKKSAKAATDDELEEELAGLEEIDDEDDDAEDADVDTDEDDDEDEDGDEDDDDEEGDEEDLNDLSNSELKSRIKALGGKGVDKKNKAQLVAQLEALLEDEEEDDEDDDEEDDDESPLDGLDRSELKAYNKEHDLGVKVLKSMSDDDLREALQEALDGDEDDDDEEEDEPPAKAKGKSKAKATPVGKGSSKKAPAKKAGAKKGTAPPKRELPKGRLGVEDVAEAAGTDARSVRMFLRTDEGREQFPKDTELNRYHFTRTEVKALVKKLKGRRGSKASKAK